jgi:hypothetical protein
MAQMADNNDTRRDISTAIFQRAFFRWENAVLFSAALLTAVFLPWPFALLALVPLIGVGVMVWVGMHETQVQTEAIQEMLYTTFDPRKLRSKRVRAICEPTLDMRREIERAYERLSSEALRMQVGGVVEKLNPWMEHVYKLSTAVDNYDSNIFLDKDPEKIAADIAVIQRGITPRTSGGILKEKQALIEAKQQRLAIARELADRIEEAYLQMQQSLENLKVIYTQIGMVNTTSSLDGFDSRSIEKELDEQVLHMGDLLSGLESTYKKKGPIQK